ncbi:MULTISPECIES: TIGR03936 family radical SAM-associated protein [unclassified Fusibacter]|uniref:TIGR03936 family radical SAM-associated protein n=1 Tax=unclassified Fusibacter TaxID=2624464 RepID=UPI0010131ACB|nr:MULTISPECIES: TIGR03936 family radical SAM-associated protein [unclassified Fusibacter]MCK8060677.1 TIGR03936 family radical SAM-associated protein [Fusibacter sp. A2]NPE22869.1 DUF2344 domain-containing protein [Fusibacter sp. A1]RXV59938.1 DUF2344 domain-containing protein [Fusibacter sp. A1]
MIIRLVYTKTEYMKFLGHLDLMRFFYRSFRRLGVPLKYSEGFNPHPKLTFGGPLSVGVSSEYEVMEVELSSMIDVDDMILRFNTTAPDGMRLKDYRIIDESRSLMSGLALMTYRVVLQKVEGIDSYALDERFNQAESILLRKKNKKGHWGDKDLKPFIADVVKVKDDEVTETYQVSVHSTPSGAAKPQHIVEILLKDIEGFSVDDVDITRTGLFCETEKGYVPLVQLT